MGYYTLVLSCFVASCEEEIQDTVAPDISITSPIIDTKLWLDVSVKADVTDDHLVSKVEFYLDDELLGEDTEAPYELDFNSKQYEDGKYTLKALAYDEGGNQTEASQEVEIFNSLLDVSVGENYLDENLESWLIISDTKGNVADYEMIENGKNIHFVRTEGMEEEMFHLMMISRYISRDQSEYEYVAINEYHGMLPNNWTLTSTNEPDSLGTAILKCDYQNDYRMNFSSFNSSPSKWTNNYSVEVDSTYSEITTTIHKIPASAFLSTSKRVNNDEPPKYVFIKDLSIGSEYNLSQHDFKSMKVGQNTIFPISGTLSVSVYGVSDEEVEYLLYSNYYNEEITNLVTYVPENEFKDYSYSLALSLGNYHYQTFNRGLPSNNFNMPQLSLEIVDNTSKFFSATVNHEADFSINVWRFDKYDDIDKLTIFRDVYTNLEEGKIEVKFMEIPVEILEKYPVLQRHLNELKYSYTSINNYDGFDVLDDYIKYRFGPNSKTPYNEKITVYSDESDARLSKVKFPKWLEEKLLRGETW